MKKISLMLLAVFFHPGAFAQIDYDQDRYVFRTSPLLPESVEEYLTLVDECNKLIADTELGGGTISIEPGPDSDDVATMVMLQSVHTRKSNGLIKEKIKREIGEMLVCQDWTDFTVDNNFVPVFYDVTIWPSAQDLDGLNFVAEGGGFSPVFGQLPGGGEIMAPIGYPAEGVFPVNFSATILPSLPPGGPFDGTGGTMTINSILNGAGNPQFETEGIGIIRFFEPSVD